MRADLTQGVGREALVGFISIALDNAPLFLDMDKCVTEHLVLVLAPLQVISEDDIAAGIGDMHVASKGPYHGDIVTHVIKHLEHVDAERAVSARIGGELFDEVHLAIETVLVEDE